MPRMTPPKRLRVRPKTLPLWWPLPTLALAGLLAGGSYGLLTAAQYAATSYVVVIPTERSDPGTALGFAQAYGRMATQIAGRKGDPRVRASTSPDAPMIEITATAARPGAAAELANDVARALTGNSSRMQSGTGVRLLQLSPATAPTVPASLSAPLTALVGGCAGGLLGGLVLLTFPRRPPAELPVAVPAPAAEVV
ncbi:hypothetical protein GCM10020367_28220 [Streptomyces sannanensis]|uniref:Lipopolysaccharide biosynthesis protein n=1 Tax=Streptomyces sannanensis TaxID=285536 RepID=A0ABP6SCA5_9ACTN